MLFQKLETKLRSALSSAVQAELNAPKQRIVTADRLLYGVHDRYERRMQALGTACGKTPCVVAASQPSLQKAPAVRGPEEAASPGDVVRGPKIEAGPGDVLKAFADLERRVKQKPDLLEQLRAKPFPVKGKAAQLDWALAYAPLADRTSDPLWSVATNDASPALVAYVHGVVAARRAGLAVDAKLEKRIEDAQLALYQRIAQDPSIYQKLEVMPFPVTEREQLIWAVGILLASWDPDQHPVVMTNPKAQALVSLAAGVLAKKANNDTEIIVRSERRTMTVDGDTRVYAVHTPPGPRPAGGWPAVVFFHGSYGGYAPEQSPDYQALNAIADQQGFQVVYPVGSPQDRADLIKTGRGMLNWDPVGAGPGGANDRFVHELLSSLIEKGEIDRTRVFVSGHSQGGFYVSNLIATYPNAFAGAAIFGAGAGSIASRASFGALPRKTPLFLHAGTADIHLPMANDLALALQAGGYGKLLKFVRPADRGHELLPGDFQKMFSWFSEHEPLEASELGTLDGKTGITPEQPVYRASIDLVNPPEELAADPIALQVMHAIAEHPFFDLDGDASKLSADEWRLAAYRLEGWPASMQQAITDLRRWFVLAPPPPDALLDLEALPAKVVKNASAVAALQHIARTPALDFDGYPHIVSERELAEAEKYAMQLPEKVRAGLIELRKLVA